MNIRKKINEWIQDRREKKFYKEFYKAAKERESYFWVSECKAMNVLDMDETTLPKAIVEIDPPSDCDQNCVIDKILEESKGIRQSIDELDNLKRERNMYFQQAKNLSSKINAIENLINNKQRLLDMEVTNFNKIIIFKEEEPVKKPSRIERIKNLELEKEKLQWDLDYNIKNKIDSIDRMIGIVESQIERYGE